MTKKFGVVIGSCLLSLGVAAFVSSYACVPMEAAPGSSEHTPTFINELSFQVNHFVVTAYDDTYEIYDLNTNEYIDADEFDRRLQEESMSTSASSDIGVSESALTSGQDFGLFYVYFRGFGADTDVHPLNPCVSEPVTHVHLTFKQHSWTPDAQAWARIHIGTFRDSSSRRCLVVYESQSRVCIRQCAPTRTDIERGLSSALDSAARAAGIVVSSAVLITAANALSYLVNGALSIASAI